MNASSPSSVSSSKPKDHIIQPPKDTRFIIAILVPAALVFVLGILFPVIIGVFISFTNSNPKNGYFGSKILIHKSGLPLNYYELLFYGGINGRDFWQYTYQTLFFSIVSVTLEVLVGLMFALILNREFRGRGLVRATLLIPWALPTVASATIFRYEIFETKDSQGVINNILSMFGMQPIDFYGPDAFIFFDLPAPVPFDPYIMDIPITATMLTAIMIDLWKTTPFLTLLILAALQIVPSDLYKAADVAGASPLEKFRHITWPLIRPAVGVAVVFRMMDAIRVYDAIVVFRDESVRSMTYQAVDFWAKSQEYGLASAVAVMEFLLIIVFALLILTLTRRKEK